MRKKGNRGLQLPACLAHGGPEDNSRPAPPEEKGAEEEEEEEEGKGGEEEGKAWPTTPSMPCACPPRKLQLPARPAPPPLPGTGSPSQGHRSAPVRYSTAQPDTCTGAFIRSTTRDTPEAGL